jgi:hypothetical protein
MSSSRNSTKKDTMKLSIAIPTLLLPLALLGCASQGKGSEAASESPKPAATGEKPDEAEVAEKIQKAERELDYARIELDLAKLSTSADAREADQSVLEATQKLEAVRKDRDNFKNVETPTKLADRQLDVDRSTQRMDEQKAELDELEAMYKNEQFASLTKELVLNRGKKQLEFAKRSLELAKKSQEQLTSFELPKKQLELDQSVDRAEKTLAEANTKKEKSALESKLKLLKSEHRVDESQLALDKAKKKDASKPKDAKA